jgi:hypothetical protein
MKMRARICLGLIAAAGASCGLSRAGENETMGGVTHCVPETCAGAGVECGAISDGCGGTLDCGACLPPCTPTSCATAGASCGTIPDGCGGDLDCGLCSGTADGGSDGAGGGGASPCAQSICVFVAPTGDDAADGSEAQPFRTPGRAQLAVRDIIAAGMTADVLVYLRDGSYEMSSPLNLGPGDSASGGYTVTWASYPGERAALTGGHRIIGWTLHDSVKNIYQASVSAGWDFRQLYVNGAHAQRTRGPDWPAGWTLDDTGFAGPGADLAGWQNPTDIEFVMNGPWLTNHCKVDSISAAHVTLQNPCFQNYTMYTLGYGASSLTRIENAYELLNDPGDFYLDVHANVVYYIPRAGEDMQTADVYAPDTEDLVVANGLSQVVFERLTFAHTNWLLPDQNGVGYVDGWGGGLATATAFEPIHSPISFTSSHDITIRHCLFTHIGSRALKLDKVQNVSLLANRFVDNAAGAIDLGSMGAANPTDPADRNLNVVIRDNYIEGGFEYDDTIEILVGYAASVTIDHNEVAGSGYDAVSVGNDGVGPDLGAPSYQGSHQVTLNYLHDFNQSYMDGGGIYTVGTQPGTTFNGNYLRTTNLAYGCLYPDEGSGLLTFSNNVCADVSRNWMNDWNQHSHDLVITGNWSDTDQYLNSSTNSVFLNNTVVLDGVWPAEAQAVIGAAGVTTGVSPGP